MDRTDFHKEINITLLIPFVTRDRAENTEIRYAMLSGNFKDLLASGSEKLFDLHNIQLYNKGSSKLTMPLQPRGNHSMIVKVTLYNPTSGTMR